MFNNLILQTDSYKLTHWKQYPPGTQFVHSYLESRGGQFDNTVFFGLQYYLDKYLRGVVVDGYDLAEADVFCEQHFGRPDLLNTKGWQHIITAHGGRLPVVIKAVEEGTPVSVGNVLMSIENTDPKCYWLPNYLETLLLKVWYPTTVATQSREIKKSILEALERSGDLSLIDFKLHDFGYRGVSSEESAALGAAAHLLNFRGTDTLPGIWLAQEYYQGGMEGFSIPAAEHSTITSWGKEHEQDAFENMLTQYPEGLVAVVSDSYNIYDACEKLWGGTLRDKVINRTGTVVVRPDSGDPIQTNLKVLSILGEKLGYEVNEKGFKVLNPKIRVIQGDGVNYFSIRNILAALMYEGWSADNIAFGMGGALLQQLNRDTQKFAFKCSQVAVNGEERDVWKEPVGDSSKGSKRGRLSLHNTGGLWTTGQRKSGIEDPFDLLKPVFRDGEVLGSQKFSDIKERAKL